MSLYMESTEIAAEKTAAEITRLLVHAGATKIMLEYGAGRKISGLSFILEIRGSEVPFILPARIEPIFQYFQKRRDSWKRDEKEEYDLARAERVAWRQLYRWIQAQLAMIDTGMVEAGEVFLPYLQVAPGKSFWEHALESGKLQLSAPAKAKPSEEA